MLCKLQKLCVNQKAWFAHPEGHVDHDVPRVHGTGCAKSGSTTCLPVPWRGWGPMGRTEQADYQMPNFEKIDVWTCLATAIESARIIRAGSNLAQWPSHAHCTGRTRVC